MARYVWVQGFEAADDGQAERLALAWADTTTAEYGTWHVGVYRECPDCGFGPVMPGERCQHGG
jgi:hypothetical protein